MVGTEKVNISISREDAEKIFTEKSEGSRRIH